MSTKKIVSKILLYLFIIVFTGAIILPFIWLLLGSLKNLKELFTLPLQILPEKLRFENYARVFQVQPFGKYIVNSFITSLMATAFSIVVSSMASYSIARVNIRGKKFILAALLSVTLLPPVTLLNPIYQLLSKVNLLNSSLGLALVLTATEMPMAVWFLTGFFQSIPFEMEEAAMVDGANMGVTFTKIILPLVAPGIFTVAILIFINSWNNYLFAQVFNQLPKARTVTVALTLFQVDNSLPWELVSAAAVIVTVPLILVVLILQKKIISGMMDGGVKG